MTALVERGSYGSQACRPTSRSSSAPGLQTVSGRANDSPPHIPDRHGGTAPRRAAAAQQAGKVYRIGYVGVAPIPLDDAFRAGLRDRGYLEGQNLASSIDTTPPEMIPHVVRARWLRELRKTSVALTILINRLTSGLVAIAPRPSTQRGE